MKNTFLLTLRSLCAALGTCSFASHVHAQLAPDAGQTLQQLQAPAAVPRSSQPFAIEPPAASGVVLPGGASVVLQAVNIAGNTVIPEAVLQGVLGEVVGKSFDLAGLRALSDRLGDYYRSSGYPFARALLPPQDLQDGKLRIDVIEGRYGQVQAVSDEAPLALRAETFLRSLKRDAVIEQSALARTSLILDDLPGIKTSLVIRPGEVVGAGDLDVVVSRDALVTGEVGLDNQGNRFTGEIRASANLKINSPFLLGDQISIRTLVSDAKLLLGSLEYSAPLGGTGLRGSVGYAHTSYVLGRDFASSQANGSAGVTSIGLSYPIIRSQLTNLSVNALYQFKNLQDNKDAINVRESKTSRSMPITLRFDRSNTASGGGIVYGILGWTPGNMHLDAALALNDTNQTRGSFNKLNVDLITLQPLPAKITFMGRLSTQLASKNLDSSEKLTAGGAGGVRAYPSGEASGDEGSLVQLEMRYAIAGFEPYAFYDIASIKTNTKPPPGTTNNSRTLSGMGLGLRYRLGDWDLDAALAWRLIGGAPQADTSRDGQPRAWMRVGSRF